MDFINENIIKCLKQEIDAYRDKYAIALQEIKELNYFSKEDNDKLKAENKRLNRVNAELSNKLQEVNSDYNNDHKVHNDYEDGLLAEIEELKAENKRLRYNEVVNKENNTKHYPKEYKQEADEYFEHNPHCNKLLFFIIEGNEFDEDGCYEACLLDDDCIAEIDNI